MTDLILNNGMKLKFHDFRCLCGYATRSRTDILLHLDGCPVYRKLLEGASLREIELFIAKTVNGGDTKDEQQEAKTEERQGDRGRDKRSKGSKR